VRSQRKHDYEKREEWNTKVLKVRLTHCLLPARLVSNVGLDLVGLLLSEAIYWTIGGLDVHS
jgi:hypothetical protein